MQNGSSIMPGKVNPVIPEVMSHVAFCIIGNDTCITMAAEAGHKKSAKVAKEVIAAGKSVREVPKEENIMSEEEIDDILDQSQMV